MTGTGYSPDDARRDLRWLATVRAVRSWTEPNSGASEPSFTVVTFAGITIALSVANVRIFRLGTLTGYRLPRADEISSGATS